MRAIEELADRDQTAKSIETELGRRGFTDYPRQRTIRDIVARVRPREVSAAVAGEWSVADARPAEAAVVLPVLSELIRLTGGELRMLSKPAARAIWRLRSASPELPAWTAFQLAQDLVVERYLVEGGAPPGRRRRLVTEFLALRLWDQDQRAAAKDEGLLSGDLTDEVLASYDAPSLGPIERGLAPFGLKLDSFDGMSDAQIRQVAVQAVLDQHRARNNPTRHAKKRRGQ